MTPKSFTVLAVATLLSVGAAAWSVARQPSLDADARAGEAFLPDLAKRANDIARLEVTEGGETLVVARTDTGWVLPDKGGFPAKVEPLRDAVSGLARLTILEAKTDRPDRHDRLGVEDPGKDKATSRRLVLKDAGGAVLADLVLGRPSYGVGGTGGLYVRRGGEDQAWLVSGQVRLPGGPTGWLDTQVADVAAPRVASVALTGGGKDPVRLSRAGEGWTLERMPRGRTLDSGKAERVAALGSLLTLEDVRPVAGLKGDGRRAEVTTSDGLVLRLARVAGEAEPWVLVTAEARADTARAEAEAITKRMEGVAVRLPAFKAELLDMAPADLLAEEAPGS